MKYETTLGECPACQDDIHAFRTARRNRLARCINEECSQHVIYPLPKRGILDPTGEVCPITGLPIVHITPILKVPHRTVKKDSVNGFFWTDRPCFTCSRQAECRAVTELKREYTEDPIDADA